MKIQTMVVVSMLMVLASSASSAAPVAVRAMNITAGSFFSASFLANPVPFGFIGPDTNLVAGYIGGGGLGRAAGDADPNRIVGFELLGLPANIYTAATNLGDTQSSPGTIAGGPVPSGIIDAAAGTITLDLSSWFANANDVDSYDGSAVAAGSWDPATHAYSLSWDVVPIPGSFVTHTWTLQGLAHPVPEPAAVFLVAAAILALSARRLWCHP